MAASRVARAARSRPSAADLEEKERSAREWFWQLMGALENQYDEQ